MHLAASARGLAGLWFAGQRHLPAQLASPVAWPVDDDHRLLRLAATVREVRYLGTMPVCRQAFSQLACVDHHAVGRVELAHQCNVHG